jgi:hypothetical protein
MKNLTNSLKMPANRRTFIKKGLAAGTATLTAGMLTNSSSANAQSAKLSKGDAAILSFLAAAEIIESDLWIRYNELGGIQDSEVPGGSAPTSLRLGCWMGICPNIFTTIPRMSLPSSSTLTWLRRARIQ